MILIVSRSKLTIFLLVAIYTCLVYLLLWVYECKGFGLSENDYDDEHYLPPVRNKTGSLNHPIYKTFYIKPPPVKKLVSIVIIVYSAPKNVDRRKTIRETWWTQCVPTKDVKPECIFSIDYQGPNHEYFHQVHNERIRYGDVHLQLVKNNISSGGRQLLYHMLWANTMYKFDYFLRMDDEQFVCLERLLTELPRPMETDFHWGTINTMKGVKLPGPTLAIFSRDVIDIFLNQDPSRMYCHPYVDRMISIWLDELGKSSLLRHDKRIHRKDHIEVSSMTHICDRLIAVQGASPDVMNVLWKSRGVVSNNVIGGLKTLSDTQTSISLSVEDSSKRLKHQPQLCSMNPVWEVSGIEGL